MAYKIIYFRAARQYIEVYWDEPLPDTRETARKGIKRNRVDYATIHDLDRDAKLIETIRDRS